MYKKIILYPGDFACFGDFYNAILLPLGISLSESTNMSDEIKKIILIVSDFHIKGGINEKRS